MRRHSIPPGPIVVAIMMGGLAFTLVGVIIARSPYTHGNLNPEGYDRTEIAYVGEEPPFEGLGLADPQLANTGDPVQDGKALFFQYGCASCHGTQAQGTTLVDDDIIGYKASRLRGEVRKGPEGMPIFHVGVLSDEDIDKIAAWLASLDDDSEDGEEEDAAAASRD
jgi:mono/diheme cytochrome c family protein